MSAYIVVQVEITDPVRYEDYRKMVPPTLTRFGGRFIVRGGQVETRRGYVGAEAVCRARVSGCRSGAGVVGVGGVCRSQGAPAGNVANGNDSGRRRVGGSGPAVHDDRSNSPEGGRNERGYLAGSVCSSPSLAAMSSADVAGFTALSMA